jgi:4-hydroxythreonine-4-phosphate dehydrogenase
VSGLSARGIVMKKKIAITMGDAGGIGPEISLQAALSEEVRALCEPVLIGDRRVFSEVAELLGIELKGVEIVEPYRISNMARGKPTEDSGRAAFFYIKEALEGCLRGDFHGMVTSPISKVALRMAGYPWAGHTEMLAELTGAKTYAMMLMGEGLRVLLVTTHLALRDVPNALTVEGIYEKICLAAVAAEMLSIEDPLIGVSALNPHAGEEGLFGTEEKELIEPAIQKAKERGLKVEGPIPADVIFYLARTGRLDIVISMYHDQGLAPLKMIAFEKGVNFTVGLPIIRTSPDHGTAYDIAWKAVARIDSMIEAIKTASYIKLPRFKE